MQQILKLPQSAKQVINEYLYLPIENKKVRVPYFMNTRQQRAGLRVLVGKGSPEEILREVSVWAKLKKVNINILSEEELRKFMIAQNIGIDCSGFVVHILNYWLHKSDKNRLISYLNFYKNSLFSKIKRKLRPVENIGANVLTSELNCTKITNFNDIKPGDLIRSKGKQRNAHHVLMISQVTLEDGQVKSFEYVESSANYGDDHGIRFGNVIITDPKGGLKEQNWTDIDPVTNRNWTYENLTKEYEDNGIRRLKNVELVASD